MSNILCRVYRKLCLLAGGDIIDAIMVLFSGHFNPLWYRKNYMNGKHGLAAVHYNTIGWKRLYCPSKHFSTARYLVHNEDVRMAQINPLLHYVRYGRKEKNRRRGTVCLGNASPKELKAIKRFQDAELKKLYPKTLDKLIVYCEPDIDTMAGGYMCICNYTKTVQILETTKQWGAVTATIPSPQTISRYTDFDAKQTIFRFDQIRPYFHKLTHLYIHIPEYLLPSFLINITPVETAWISCGGVHVTINIMNQRNDIMLPPEFFTLLKKICPNVTMTCAHEKYCNKYLRSTYDLPIHYIPADKKPDYFHFPFHKKKDIVALSPDESPYRSQVIAAIKDAMPHVKIRVIQNLKYQSYLKLIAECKWVITFGEGFDAYLIEPLYSGTISFAVSNNTFFNKATSKWPNIYTNYSEMINRIGKDMQRLNTPKTYNEFLNNVFEQCKAEYASHKYEERMENYYKGIYDLDTKEIRRQRNILIAREPLVSVVLFTDDRDRRLSERVSGVLAQTYHNLELVLVNLGAKKIPKKMILQSNVPVKIVSFPSTIDAYKNIEAVRAGVNASNGEYLTLSTRYSVWTPKKIQELLGHIDDFDGVFGDSVVKMPNGAHTKAFISSDAWNPMRWFQAVDVLRGDCIDANLSLYRRKMVEDVLCTVDINIKEISVSRILAIYAQTHGGCCYINVMGDIHDYNDLKKYSDTSMQPDDFLNEQKIFYLWLRDSGILNGYDELKKMCIDRLNWCDVYKSLCMITQMGVSEFMNRNSDGFHNEDVQRFIQHWNRWEALT